jgi:RHS repeat-associated protein
VLVAEYEGETLRRRYAHWAGSDVPLLWFTNSDFNSPNYLHADQQGSIVMLSGAGTPTINRYDEYGIPQSTNTGRFQYTGQAYLPELGLYYYKARLYSPTLGRFLQTDPIGYQGGINLYGYVGDDPINNTDPDGECTSQQVANSHGATSFTAICKDPANLHTSREGLQAIISEERPVTGRVQPSAEGGAGTVGVGHKAQPGDNLRIGDRITRAQLAKFFVSDIQAAEARVRTMVGRLPLSQREFDALVDLQFNVRQRSLSRSSSPGLHDAIRRGDYEAMSNNLRYTQGAGRTMGGLEDRSERRRNIFRDGNYAEVP